MARRTRNRLWRLAAASALVVLLPTAPRAGDIYVKTHEFSLQAAAQEAAAVKGGWVLDGALYDGLSPDSFLVVRGPFADAAAAVAALSDLPQAAYPSASVIDAGALKLPQGISGRPLPATVLASLLGEILLEVTEQPGGRHGCEPGEPYLEVALSYVRTRPHPTADGETTMVPERTGVDVGAFWVITRTGEIQRMRSCGE